MQFDREFEGKRVVITGACGLYGRGMVEAFAKEGAKVCLTDRSEDELKDFFEEISPPKGSFYHATDLTDAASMDGLLVAVANEWGSADILINNAGLYPSAFMLDMTVEDWDLIFDVNLRAPFVLTRGIAIQMIKAGHGGSIVNVGSGASRRMRRTVVPYCTSKTALDRLTKGFALELAEYGIRVNAFEPGFAAGSDVSALSEEHVKRAVAGVPLGRATEHSDVAPAVFYLCSEAASYVTGTTLTVDGGHSIGWLDVYQDKKQAL